MLEALTEAEIEREDSPVLRGGLAAWTILEHEPMHQETLDYMWRRLPYEKKVRPADATQPRAGGRAPRPETARIPAGRATLGAAEGEVPFGWDNEFPKTVVDVSGFSIDKHSVTNGEFLEFVERRSTKAGKPGGRAPVFWERQGQTYFWRGQWGSLPLPLAWPAWVSHAEASAYARWKGRRLPTEAEYHRAAFGTPGESERLFPWGDAPPDPTRGNFDFQSPEPVPVGSYPAGASAWGVHDLVGNGWEWTSTVFEPFPGFTPMPSYPLYSADFFDGKHYVMKGASPVTAKELIRRSFRNWFRGNYPYMYAKFRLVHGDRGVKVATKSMFAESTENQSGTLDPHVCGGAGGGGPGVRRRRAAGSRAAPEAAAVEVSLRRARLGALRGDLPAALVPHHARRGAAPRGAWRATWSRSFRIR